MGRVITRLRAWWRRLFTRPHVPEHVPERADVSVVDAALRLGAHVVVDVIGTDLWSVEIEGEVIGAVSRVTATRMLYNGAKVGRATTATTQWIAEEVHRMLLIAHGLPAPNTPGGVWQIERAWGVGPEPEQGAKHPIPPRPFIRRP